MRFEPHQHLIPQAPERRTTRCGGGAKDYSKGGGQRTPAVRLRGTIPSGPEYAKKSEGRGTYMETRSEGTFAMA